MRHFGLRSFSFVFTFVGLFSLATLPVQAASLSSLQSQKQSIDDQKKQAATEQQQKQQQADDLQTQLDQLNGQIEQTQDALQKTEQNIHSTEADLETTKQKIADAESQLKDAQELLSNLVSEEYISDHNQFLRAIVGSTDISDFYKKLKEYEAFQQQVKDLTDKIETLQRELDETRANQEHQLADLKSLSDEQVVQKSTLEGQQSTKTGLLNDTKNTIADLKAKQAQMDRTEASLQSQIEEVIAEQIRLAKARSSGGTSAAGPAAGGGQAVSIGQYLGRVGTTGFSTGYHLHFEVRNSSGEAVNPGPWVRANQPLEAGSYNISQGFGMTPYALSGAYGGGPHTGFDMAAPAGTPISAACNGTIIFHQYYGGYGNATMLACNDGTYELYGHMIE